MKLLAIDTSTECCSAALYCDGDISECNELAPRRHAELILPMVDQLLADTQIALKNLDALAFGRGPGSFTGVRIAAGVIQGLAFAADLPVVPVSSLAALAQGAMEKSTTLFSAIDARMNEIYWGVFTTGEKNIVIPVGEEQVMKPDLVEIPMDVRCFGIGSGFNRYPDILRRKLGACLSGFDGNRYPSAADMIPLALRDFESGLAVSAEKALPVYLRDRI